MIPDDILLEIFDLYKEAEDYGFVWNWSTLLHVCRRWRQVVFTSPLRLYLRILCTYRIAARNNLDIWPAFPIVIDYFPHGIATDDEFEDNIIAEFKHRDRVYDVKLSVTCSELEKITSVMQEPFPVLTGLHIHSRDLHASVLPAKFLGGSASCLQVVDLDGIPFPALPTLLLSTSDLVTLYIRNIPPTGYISPEAMVMVLAALPSFIIHFQSATSRPDRIHPPSPVTRSVLSALTYFLFEGASEYLEDLVVRIDAPQLDQINIYYLNQLVDFQVVQISKFIEHSIGPKLTLFKYAQVSFYSGRVIFNMSYENGPCPEQRSTTIICQGIDWQVSHMAQVLSQFPVALLLSAAVHLKLGVDTEWVSPTVGMDEVDWRLLLLQFSTMKTLHVAQEISGHVALALEHMVTGALPSLDLILLEGQPASSVETFVTTRKVSGRLVTIVNTETEFDERFKSYISK